MRTSSLLRSVRRLAPGLIAVVAATAAGAQRTERFTAWSQPIFPAAEYRARHAAVLAALGPDDVMLIPGAEGTSSGDTFRQLDDFEYLTGLEVPRSVIVISGATRRVLLVVPATDPRFENPGRPNDFPGRPLAADPALRALSGVDSVLTMDALDDLVRGLATPRTRFLVNRGGRSPASAQWSGMSSPDVLLEARLRQVVPGATVADAYRILAALRMVKSPREIALMREAARVTTIAIARGAARVRPGVDERTLMGDFISDCLALGAERQAFEPIIKSGPNSLWPWRILGAHYSRRNRAMAAGELVIYDVGCERRHYVSDIGRTFPVASRFTPRQRELVEMVRAISDSVIAAAKPGTTLAALQRAANAAIPVAARPYMQAPLYFGHHLGLDSGDPSLTDAVLQPGMIFTIEPWYYNHDDNVAVFIEDEILITADGSENLTAHLPRDATGLERMRQGQLAALSDADHGRSVTRDGVLAFTLDAARGAVEGYDLLNGQPVGRTAVCTSPISGELSPDDVSFVVRCRGSQRPVYVNTASLAVSPPPVAPSRPARVPGTRGARTEVAVVGTIHGPHRTSTRYSNGVFRSLIAALRPDFVLTEIPPNRFDAAMREYAATGTIVEPRVLRFPEYVDVLIPMARSRGFVLIPTAGWTKPMDAYRTAALRAIEADPSRRAEWAEYTRATRRADSLVTVFGSDNPYFLNSAAYDSIQTAAHEPYNRLFNAELGPGGWDNINEAHFANIARALDVHRGEGRRFVITYGAGHKEWFMRALRARDDVTILDVAPYLRQIGAR
jgi:Xaa-Pro aminopeptidase